MTEYRLTAITFREVTARDAAGNVTEERRYRQGDVIDLSGSEEQRLLLAGALAPLDADHSDHAHAPIEVAPDPSDDGAEKPKKAAPVDEWREYAVAQGFDREQVEEMTKAELVAAVG